MIDTLRQDLFGALRALVRRPVFSSLSLALLVLASTTITAIFAVVNAALLRPLPYRDPAALVAIRTTEPVAGDSLQNLPSTALQLARWRSDARTLTTVEGWTPVTMSLSGNGDPRALRGFAISSGLFDLLGTPPTEGRAFRRDEEIASPGVAILSNAVATAWFGSSASAIGKRVTLDGEPRTVVGVMPAGYSMLFQGGDVWIPLDLTVDAQTSKTRLRIIAAYGRLRSGVSAEQARADLATLQRTMRSEFPDAFRYTDVRLVELREALFGNQRQTMSVLMFAVLLVVIIAAVNVGNLTIADVIARRSLTMTRLALGASPGSIVRMHVAESVILVVVATALGLCGAVLALSALGSVNPAAFATLGGHAIDWRVIAVAIGATSAIGLGAALPVAFVDARVDIASIASVAVRSIGAKSDQRARQLLIAAQVAVTVVLLVGATLLGRQVSKLLASDPGFTPRSTIAVILNLPGRDLPTAPARAQYVESLVSAVKGVAGVEGASTIQSRFILNETMQTGLEIEGRPATSGVQDFSQVRHVMPDVFSVMGIRVMRGRGIDSTDRVNAVPVAVVSQSFARQYWPGQDALGKRIRRAGRADAPWMTVVGIVAEVSDAGLGVPLGPTLYLPYLQQNTATARVTLVLRSRTSATAINRAVREAIWKVNPAQAIDEVASLSTLMDRTTAQPRFQAVLLVTFGVAALLLVMAGVYALTLYTVLGRKREFGVRAALGAAPGTILTHAMHGSMRPVILGSVVGCFVAAASANILDRVLGAAFDLRDLPLLAVTIAGLVVAALIAALIPARRAARISPAVALHE